jgi:carboxypeptidase Taq
MQTALEALNQRLLEVQHLDKAAAVLDWDQQTYMPPAGVQARANQRAAVRKLAHAAFTDAETGRLLEAAEAEVVGAAPESDDAALVRVVRRDFDKATRLPPELVAERAKLTSLAQESWTRARAADDYNAFAPWLERILDLTRRTADALGHGGRMYDALIDQYEPGVSSAALDVMFAELRSELVPLLADLMARGTPVDDALLHQPFELSRQQEFGERLLRECGFEFERGRQDRAVHPFCTSFSRDDVRITTRYDAGFLSPALFATLHEMGHGLYELGLPARHEGNALCDSASLGIHESQSRMWENLVGRSRGFWSHYYPQLQAAFPEQLSAHTLDAFYRAINRVSPSFIRVEADEVTYNLHILLRYELEQALLEGRLSVADAPEAWRAKSGELLGVVPPTDREGILQDVHWSIGIMGYFPTYTIGNLMSSQLYEAAIRAHPEIPGEIPQGNCGTLLRWLRNEVHEAGRKELPHELVARVSGSPPSAEAFLRYLRTKFGEVYQLT